MEFEPERITELSAFLAARLAIVLLLVVFPPVSELIMFVLRELATEDAALVAARRTTFVLSAACF